MWIEEERDEVNKLLTQNQHLMQNDTPKDLKQVDFYDQEFQNLLREFCHTYQTPFLESNIPKTAQNAAKIYFRLKQDGEIVNKRFKDTKLLYFLESLSFKDVDDSFNPFKMKQMWKKFFRQGMSKLQVDNDRSLKNELSEPLWDYINDHYLNFSDS